MKANEAPEKIWVDPATDLPKLSGHIDKNSVEYTRTDAFIKRALRWMISKSGVNDALSREMIEDFKNYMKGE